MNNELNLLDEIDTVLNPKKVLNGAFLIYTILSVVFVALTLFPKVYIQQQIYFKSRDISKLKGEYDTLKEENKLINASVESIRFKNQVLDTIF